MGIAFIDNRCAGCGKLLTEGEHGIILGDVQIKESQIVTFSPGMDTRNVYCNVFCLHKDLREVNENPTFN